jgi:putative endonuclease
MSSPDKTTLYTGVTSELETRVQKHREKFYPKSFSKKYNCTQLVYFRFFDSIEEAIAEEKRLKGGKRVQKLALIEGLNPEWRDLWPDLDKLAW